MSTREVRNELELPAAPAVVWDLMTDTAGLSSWNPHLVRVDGELRAGAVVTLHYAQRRRWMPSRFEVDVRTFEPERELRFEGPRSRARALLRASHYYLFAPGDDPDSTRFVHGERFEGALAAAIWPLLGPVVRAGHKRLNDALANAISARL